MQKLYVIAGLVGALAAGPALAQKGPMDPAGSPTGQMQRDQVDQQGKAERMREMEMRGPKDPAGTHTGQMQRDEVETGVSPGGGTDPNHPKFDNPAGTQSGPK